MYVGPLNFSTVGLENNITFDNIFPFCSFVSTCSSPQALGSDLLLASYFILEKKYNF